MRPLRAAAALLVLWGQPHDAEEPVDGRNSPQPTKVNCVDMKREKNGKPAMWYDGRGETCAWYAEQTSRCQTHGQTFGNFGMWGATACCACGGGLPSASADPLSSQGDSADAPPPPPEGVCRDELGLPGAKDKKWYDARGEACEWYAADASRCKEFGKANSNFGLVAKKACCACGGGVREKGDSGRGPYPYALLVVTGSRTLTMSGDLFPKKGEQVVFTNFPYLAWVALDGKGSMRSHNDCPHGLATNLTVGGGNWTKFRGAFIKYRRGHLSPNHDARAEWKATWDEAVTLCLGSEECKGFTYNSVTKKPKQRVTVWFKSAFKLNANTKDWHSWKVDAYAAENECREQCRKGLGEGVEPDPWCILESSPDDSMEKIKKKYKSLVLKLHPDKHKDKKKSQKKFIDVQNAWEALGDQERKTMAYHRRNGMRVQRDPYEKNEHVTRLTRSMIEPTVFSAGNGSSSVWLIHVFNEYDQHYRGMNSEKIVPFSRAVHLLAGSVNFGAIDCYDWGHDRTQQTFEALRRVCNKLVPDGEVDTYQSEIVLVVPAEKTSIRYDSSWGLTGEALANFARHFARVPRQLQRVRKLPPMVNDLEGGGDAPSLWLATKTSDQWCSGCEVARSYLARSSVVVDGLVKIGGILECSSGDITGVGIKPPKPGCSYGFPSLLLISGSGNSSCANCYHEGIQQGCFYNRELSACTTPDRKYFCRNVDGQDRVATCLEEHKFEPLLPDKWSWNFREFQVALTVMERMSRRLRELAGSSDSCQAKA